MTNFDYLKEEKRFDDFADVAILAEKSFNLDYSTCAFNCRRAMEFAVKWIYSVDNSLERVVDGRLINLLSTADFEDLVGKDLLTRMHFIRIVGNDSAHKNKKVTEDKALLCLENLFIFFDFVSYCYGENYVERVFDKGLLTESKETVIPKVVEDIKLDTLYEENKNIKNKISKVSEEKRNTYKAKPLELSEFETRKLYIDVMLEDSGWIVNKNWLNEVEVNGMPIIPGVNESSRGYVDYVLYGDDSKPLAIVEAKRTCKGVEVGRTQAKLYADCLEKQFGRRPIIFLSNGFETRIIDGQYSERTVANVYSKRDLEKLYNLRMFRKPLNNIEVDKNVAGRYYQEAAIKAVCDTFEANKRDALLVMATGSGKTRTVIELCNVLNKNGYVKNILFLADRRALINQAKGSFTKFAKNMTLSSLLDRTPDFTANVIFSTYKTMINYIDEAKHEDDTKIFTSGHFDLVICDEAHRSIYNKYKDIFNYFDSLLVGLTATPKDEIDKNTYGVFKLQNGVPTYGYELAQAVKDGYLVDYKTVESKVKFLTEGIVYADLSDEEKEEYEKTFADENGEIPESMSPSAMNEWIFNEDTIRKVLNVVMQNGLRIESGSKIGKTIIFAKNHEHAEKIYEVFGREYSHLTDYARVIDNYDAYAQSSIDDFSEANKMPQIAISVDMLDTGIDVPEILNLVFFKKVMSKAKFWQMIGRGTRLCEGLIDGEDKEKFYIFDFLGNFEFFRVNKGKESNINFSVQEAIFNLKVQMIYKLQGVVNQNAELNDFRNSLIDDVVEKILELDKNNSIVRLHLKYIEIYSDKEKFNSLSYEDTLTIENEITSLVLPYKDEYTAVRFDALMYGIELAYIIGENNKKGKNDLLRRVKDVSNISNIPEIIAKKELIDKILNTDYIETADINEFENIRLGIRNLIKYIDKKVVKYYTDIADDILEMNWNDSELENDDLENYRKKAELYIKDHQETEAIKKLKTNTPLTENDIRELESILWVEVGTKTDYDREFGEKPLGEFVREIVGLDMKAAKEAFAEYLNNNSLNSSQIYFVNQIIEYIVHNGVMSDFSVLQNAPFTDKGSIVDVFDDLSVWNDIKSVIIRINKNAQVA